MTQALTFETTSSRLAVEVSRDDFLALTVAEEILAKGNYLSPHLSARLENINGVWEVEYNGHFGAYIHLTLDTEDDTPEVRQQIADIITDQLAKARVWKRER